MPVKTNKKQRLVRLSKNALYIGIAVVAVVIGFCMLKNRHVEQGNIEVTNAIYEKLPISNSLYSIQKSYDTKAKHSTILIKADEIYLESAVTRLYKEISNDNAIAGYDIRLDAYDNPFESTEGASTSDDLVTYLSETYPLISQDEYAFSTVVDNGDYYGVAACSNKNVGGAFARVTRFVLKKDADGQFQSAGTPYPIFTKYNTEVGNIAFLNKINLLRCNS